LDAVRRLNQGGLTAIDEFWHEDVDYVGIEGQFIPGRQCTLCSCYPREILGLPPDWYKLKPYRARAVKEPRAVLAEFGTIIPNDVEIRVSDSTA
jgi:hypothetical protein